MGNEVNQAFCIFFPSLQKRLKISLKKKKKKNMTKIEKK